MVWLMRRRFVRSCFYLTMAGLCSSITARLAFGRQTGTDMLGASLQTKNARPGTVLEPTYRKLHESGELYRRGKKLWGMMDGCRLCPRECGAGRLEGEEGFCEGSSQLEVSSYNPHYGEERPLVGRGGSGTIFFTNCGLRCVFCINWETSQEGHGNPTTVATLAGMMLVLQDRGCHNINIVTPTHYVPHMVQALDLAAERGLRIPLVYNTCGWERLEILEVLDGIVDIYLPDFKYASGKMAAKYSSGADSYPDLTQAALLEMHRQVGVARPAHDGLMYRGLMIRHLVMPNDVGGSKYVMRWIADNLPSDTYVNIMSQYRPMYKASDHPAISRRITREEYAEVVSMARELGLTNLDVQGFR